MRRSQTALLVLAGAGLPAVAAAVVLVGCCVLPFHGVIHRLLPLCQTAAAIVGGEGDGGHDHSVPAPPPQRTDDERGPAAAARWSAGVFPALAVTAQTVVGTRSRLRALSRPEATRCDDDVGARLTLLRVFRT